jgi:hypothetical protein
MRLIPSDPDIETVVGRIADRSLDLQPDFQRGSVWSRPKQRLLIDSIVRSWYVPPIHVVRTDDDQQEVLDGQQRLRAIWEFVQGRFSVDGSADPANDEVAALDGLHYAELPATVRRRFDRFTLRVFEVIDYEPEEPYELFFRLNQPTTLTSAEKRNAFFGEARDQVKHLTDSAESAGMTPERIGFASSRMAYEDVVSRFLWTLEEGSLTEKITAARITERYRSEHGFDLRSLNQAEEALHAFFSLDTLSAPEVKLNKATAHSWLVFAARDLQCGGDSRNWDSLVYELETARTALKRSEVSIEQLGIQEGRLLSIFNDRATARVNDVSSVLLRDMVIWLMYAERSGVVQFELLDDLRVETRRLRDSSDLERGLLRFAELSKWGSLR